MKLLIDTQALLWAITDENKLPGAARAELLNSDNQLFFSAASYWEICIKLSIGKLKLASNWKTIIDRELNKNAIRWVSIEKQHMQKITTLPWHHRDPFDRMLVAQAMCEKYAIITSDEQLSLYNIKTVW